jgi:hypothetical protein
MTIHVEDRIESLPLQPRRNRPNEATVPTQRDGAPGPFT